MENEAMSPNDSLEKVQKLASREKDKKITSREESKKLLEIQRDKDREKVTGKFKFYEVPGGTLEFVYRGHKGDPIEKYTLVDNQIYDLPLGVARHLANDGWYPVHKYVDQELGINKKIGEKIYRYDFHAINFLSLSKE